MLEHGPVRSSRYAQLEPPKDDVHLVGREDEGVVRGVEGSRREVGGDAEALGVHAEDGIEACIWLAVREEEPGEALDRARG